MGHFYWDEREKAFKPSGRQMPFGTWSEEEHLRNWNPEQMMALRHCTLKKCCFCTSINIKAVLRGKLKVDKKMFAKAPCDGFKQLLVKASILRQIEEGG